MYRMQHSQAAQASTIDYLLSVFNPPPSLPVKRVRFEDESNSLPVKRQKVIEPLQRLAAVISEPVPRLAPILTTVMPELVPSLATTPIRQPESIKQTVLMAPSQPTKPSVENRIFVISEKTVRGEKVLCDPLPAKFVRPITVKFMSDTDASLSIEVSCVGQSTLFIKKGATLSLTCELALYAKCFSQIEFVPDFSQATVKSSHDKARRSTSPVTVVVKYNGIPLYQWRTKVHSKSTKEETAPRFLWFACDQHILKASGDQNLFVGAHLGCLCSAANCSEAKSLSSCPKCTELLEQEKLLGSITWLKK